jgi:hypothetical protein
MPTLADKLANLNFKPIPIEEDEEVKEDTKGNVEKARKIEQDIYIRYIQLKSAIDGLSIDVGKLRRQTIKDCKIEPTDAQNKLNYICNVSLNHLHVDEFEKFCNDKLVSLPNIEAKEQNNKNNLPNLASITVSKLLKYKTLLNDNFTSYAKLTNYNISLDSHMAMLIETAADINFIRTLYFIIGKNLPNEDIGECPSWSFTSNEIIKWQARLEDVKKVQRVIDLLNYITGYNKKPSNKSYSMIVDEINDLYGNINMPDKYSKCLYNFIVEAYKHDLSIETMKPSKIRTLNDELQDKTITKISDINTRYSELQIKIKSFQAELDRMNCSFDTNYLTFDKRSKKIIEDMTDILNKNRNAKMMSELLSRGHNKVAIIKFRRQVRSGELKVPDVRLYDYICTHPFETYKEV